MVFCPINAIKLFDFSVNVFVIIFVNINCLFSSNNEIFRSPKIKKKKKAQQKKKKKHNIYMK
jgi:hypothetical protein